MKKEQLATFSDAVVAIIITLMVLEIKLPAELNANTILPLAQHVGIYSLSFIIVAIAWLNIHIALMPLEWVGKKIIWLNLSFLFFVSLVPLPTQALGEHFHQRESHIFYAIVLAAGSTAYSLLNLQIAKRLNTKDQSPAHLKHWLATLLFALSIPLSFISVYLSTIIFILLPILYLLPSNEPRGESE